MWRQSVLRTALILLIITATGGIVLVANHLRDMFPPLAVSLLHAFSGISGILLLLYAVVQGDGGSLAIGALWVFSIAAIAGLHLGLSHGRHVSPPKRAMLTHSSLAVIAVGALLAAVMEGG